MFVKITLDYLYVANYVSETLEYIYTGIYNPVTITHHFKKKSKKQVFIALMDNKQKFVGYMNLFDGQVYSEKFNSTDDYDLIVDQNDQNGIASACKTNSGYYDFEPLSNYNSKYIKPYMTLSETKKALKDINRQISKINEKGKTKQFLPF